jgi:hypothetical protein
MPPVLAAVVGLGVGTVASGLLGTGLTLFGTSVFTGFGILGATGASIVGGLIGLAVTTGLGALLGTKPKSAALSPTDRQQILRTTIGVRTLVYGQAKVSGPEIYSASSGADQRYLHLVIPLASHPIQSIDALWINDTRIPAVYIDGGGMVTDGDLAGLVRVKRYLGTQTTADADLISESPDGWSSDHKLLGIAYIYVRLEFNQDKFATGLNNVAAEIHGKSDILDPRTGTTGYSDNWALCVLDYLRSPYGLECADDEIDTDSFIAAANVSDEEVQLDAGATVFQPRYQMHGVVALDRKPIDIMTDMETAGGAGALVYVQGAYRLYAGAYSAPTDTLEVSDLAGSIKLVTKAPIADIFNAVKGTYVNPSDSWQEAEYPAVIDTAAAAEDGETIWAADLALPFTIDATMAQRLATIYLRRARAAQAIQVPVRYAGIRWTAKQMLAVTLDDFGFADRAFSIEKFTFDPPTGAITLSLMEQSADIYAWTYDLATAPLTRQSTTLINPLSIPAPTAAEVDTGTVIAGDGTAALSLLVTWTPAAHAFVTGTEVQWQLDGAASWNSAVIPVPTGRFVIAPVKDGDEYHVRLRAVAGLVRSAWTTAVTATGAADATAPGVPTGLAGVGVARGAALHWTNPGDDDLAGVEVWELAETTGAVWTRVVDTLAEGYTRFGLAPAEARQFKLRAYDRTGNLSAFCTAIEVTASLLATDDVGAGQISADTLGSISASISVNRDDAPSGGYTHGVLGGVDVTVERDGRLLVVVQVRGATATSAGSSGETVNGSETGGGGGGG